MTGTTTAALLLGSLVGTPPLGGPEARSAAPIRFRDVAAASGLAEHHWWGSFRHGRILVTVGGGVAWGDHDGDGDLDLVLSQGVSKPEHPEHPHNCARLLRNDRLDDGPGRFVDVTAEAGLRACGWGYGTLFEDLDGDGNLDLYLTFLGPDQLWLNQGDGSFEENAVDLGLADPDFHTGAAALDYDGDGDLDLYAAGYIDTTAEVESARGPFDLQIINAYDGVPDRLYEQIDGHFVPTAGVIPEAPPRRGLGVVAADLDADGWTDVYVANDRDRNTLLLNDWNGGFQDVTPIAGVGLGLTGRAESGMGVAAGDVDANGLLDLLVTNFSDEPVNLYANLGDATFVDRSREAGLFAPSHDGVGWATGLPDLDNDGVLDLFVAQGHLVPRWLQRITRLVDRREAVRRYFLGPYRQPLLVMRGTTVGRSEAEAFPIRFRSIEETARIPSGVWRGGVAVDVDGDGLVDLFLYSANPRVPSRLLSNRTTTSNHWIGIRLRRPGRPPPVAGTRVTILERHDHGSGSPRVLQIVSGDSYLGGSAGDLHAGLGGTETVGVEIRRPGERPVRLLRLPADRLHVF